VTSAGKFVITWNFKKVIPPFCLLLLNVFALIAISILGKARDIRSIQHPGIQRSNRRRPIQIRRRQEGDCHPTQQRFDEQAIRAQGNIECTGETVDWQFCRLAVSKLSDDGRRSRDRMQKL
jgi:hypothetical protein